MKMKKIINMLISVVFCLFISVLGVKAADVEDMVEYEYYSYTYRPEKKQYISLQEYTGDREVTEIEIPAMIDGIPVRTIGRDLFAGMDKLEKVIFPVSIREIYSGAFEGCTSLSAIDGLQNDVEYVLVNAPVSKTFGDTPWYQNKVEEAGTGVIMIGTTVYDMTHCSGKVTIPAGATTIASTAMKDKYIEKTKKTNLDITSIVIPKSLVNIDNPEHIAGLGKLKSITVNTNNKVFYSTNGILFTNYAWGVDEEKEVELIVYPAQKTEKTYTVPAKVKRIRAIRSQYLTTVKFASDYKKSDYVDMLDYAFAGCKKLKQITLPTYCHLSNYTFKDTALTSLYLPKGVIATTSNMGVMAFSGMNKLEKITVHKDSKSYKVKNGVLMSKDNEKLLLYPAAKTGTSYTIPTGTTSASLLNEVKNLKTIVVPKSLKQFNNTSETMTSIRNIKYCGTKSQWKEVKFRGVKPNTDEYISGCTTKFTMYYNCKSLSNAKITISKSSYKYTGKAIKPTVTVKMNGTKLKNGTHYTVAYKNNKKTGTATITITGKGKYYGVRTKQFKIKK